jgi:ABC-type Zn uptake system ZnuABC Zn-binding protein ZnuA
MLEIVLLAVAAGLLGTYVVMRGLAFYAHAVGTAAFPGLVLADGLGFAPPLGAVGAAVVFALGVERLARGARTGYDSLTALVLAAALAAGIVLASDVFHSGSNVDGLLFGSLLALEPRDLALAGAVSAAAVVATLLAGLRWLASGFDPAAARALGLRSPVHGVLLLVLVAATAVASIAAVGALLATALLVVPAATMRLYTARLARWQVGSVALAALEGMAGLWASVRANAPPGATIAVLGGGVFALSALARGLPALWRRLLPPLAAVAALAVLAVATDDGTAPAAAARPGAIRVVATTTQIADLVHQVGGDAVDLHRLLAPNTDPHAYEPRPADVVATGGAAVVFVSGDGLDRFASRIVSAAGGSPAVVDLGARVPVRLPGEGGEGGSAVDPHWWHDPRNAEAAVVAIRDALAAAEPAARSAIAARAASYLGRLRRLDAAIARCVDAVPPAQRRLVSDHDAFGYFARRYGIAVVGAVIPSQTTGAQPSAGDLAKLVDVIRREHVRAVFPEHALSAKLAAEVARETSAREGRLLYGDALGPAGSPAATYLGMEAWNADAMVRGFSGGRLGCRAGGGA